MRPAAFAYLRQLLHREAGIALDDGKEYLVQARLGPVARRLGLESVDGLVSELRRRPGSELEREVVEALVTTETSFFRDVHPFESLREVVLPELISRRRSLRTLRIWSAACSSGQEPYSIAILLRESFPELEAWDVRILASDVSRAMIERARAGRYTQLEINRGLPTALLLRYFERDGLFWRAVEPIRRMVELREINLTRPLPPLPAMDLIFLRNVLIYFGPEARRRILERVLERLAPDGYLLVGGAETLVGEADLVDRVQIGRTSYYRRRTDQGA